MTGLREDEGDRSLSGEASCLTMAWAVMDLVIAGSRSLGLTLRDRHAIPNIVAARSTHQTEEQIA